jgi:peptidoglycan-N-acetylglucosamine deacetylase
MIRKITLCFFPIVFLYMLLPYILTFGFGLGVIKRKKDSEQIMITFDDGPNPIYTPMALDVLKKHGVNATFFVHGSKAMKHPELLLRMQHEGHLIGMHNNIHRSNWLMGPYTTKNQLNECSQAIKDITNIYPNYYRPPWGLVNIFYPMLLKEYKIILWSVMVKDWKNKGGSERIKKELLLNMKQGDIILLHDNDETTNADEGAPINTMQALDEVLKVAKSKGYQFGRVDE